MSHATEPPLILGVVGLGDMGLPMAQAAVRGGVTVIPYDLRDLPLAAMEALGARRARSLSDLAQRAAVISIMVVSEADVRTVVEGADGLLAWMKPGGIVVVQSTVAPAAIVELADKAALVGVHVIDAPVSGGSVRAAAGELTVMCGGPIDVVERCRPFLAPMGRVRHLGGLGAGQAMKLVNNMIVSAERAVIREAMQLGDAFGILEADAREILLDSTAESWVLHNWDHLQRMYVDHQLASEPERLIDLMTKDIWQAVLTARSRRVFLPITAMIAQTLPATHAQQIALMQG